MISLVTVYFDLQKGSQPLQQKCLSFPGGRAAVGLGWSPATRDILVV